MVDGVDRGVSVVWALVGALVAVLVELLGHPSLLGPAPLWMRAGVLAVFAVFAALSTINARRRLPTRDGWPVEAWVRAASWAAAGVWVAAGWQWGLTGRYWQVRSWRAETWWPQFWLAGLVLAAVATAAAAVYAVPTDLGELNADGQPKPLDPAGPAVEWADRLARLDARFRSRVDGVEPRPNGTGYAVTGELVDDKMAWDDLAGYSKTLTTMLRGGPGTGVEVGPVPGGHAGQWRISVTTKDTLAAGGRYLDWFGTEARSILDQLPRGRYTDGGTAVVSMRQTCGMTVAETGGGKTNDMHEQTHNYVACHDTLVWIIDTTGAGLALPWVLPYLNGGLLPDSAGAGLERCPIDWVAADVDEALIMTSVALQMIRQRRTAYAPLKARMNTGLMPVSRDVPAVRILLDETAESAGVYADPRLAANIVRIVQTGRDAGFRVDFSLLSATASIVPRDALKHIRVRAVFNVNDEAEVGYALGWRTKLALGESRYPGEGWIRPSMADGIRRYRTPLSDEPDGIAAFARACEARRPPTDEPSMRVPGRAQYLSRWARAVPLLTGSDEPVHAPSGGRPVSLDVRPPEGTAEGAPGAGSGLDAALARARHVIAGERVKGAPPERVDAEFERIAGGLADDRASGGEGWVEGTPPAGGDPRARMLAIVEAAGPAGISGPRVQDQLAEEGFEVPTSTLYTWLNGDCAKRAHGAYVAARLGGTS
jgi:hypothetical protein